MIDKEDIWEFREVDDCERYCYQEYEVEEYRQPKYVKPHLIHQLLVQQILHGRFWDEIDPFPVD